jgi:hypothetical protein
VTKTIPLTQGMFAMVDEEDYERIGNLKWYYDKTGYACRRDMKTRKIVRMHRIIMEVKDKNEVDHINGNGLDNRKSNLRICSHADNSKNMKIQKNNTSGFKGVCWDKQAGKWRARIGAKLVGLYKDKYEAVLAYEKASSEQFEEFKRRILI